MFAHEVVSATFLSLKLRKNIRFSRLPFFSQGKRLRYIHTCVQAYMKSCATRTVPNIEVGSVEHESLYGIWLVVEHSLVQRGLVLSIKAVRLAAPTDQLPGVGDSRSSTLEIKTESRIQLGIEPNTQSDAPTH